MWSPLRNPNHAPFRRRACAKSISAPGRSPLSRRVSPRAVVGARMVRLQADDLAEVFQRAIQVAFGAAAMTTVVVDEIPLARWSGFSLTALP